MENTAAKTLYDLLVTRDFDPEILDSQGKAVMDPNEAELFSFDWKTDEKNYGTVVVLLGDDNQLEVYYGDNLGRAMEGDDKADWYSFLEQLKNFAVRNMMTFDLNNLNRLKYTMQGMAAIKEGLFEGYYGTKKFSYSDQPKKTRLIIKHNRELGEGEARFRNIDSLFVETEDGSRFRLPFRKLEGGRAMARHCAEGGTPYDAFGQHITQMVNEMNTLARFIRAAKHRKFDEEATALVETAVRHYQDLKAKAKRMISQHGYREERERFDPAQFTDSEVACEAIRDMFIERSIDHRIEEALPVLARLADEEAKTTETRMFEQWADEISEGTWALPDTAEKQKRLADLMANEFVVGADATNATEQLYDILGDDHLYDQLGNLADENPNADARPVVRKRMEELGVQVDSEPEPMEPVDDKYDVMEPNTDAESGEDYDDKDIGEDLDTDGVMMTKQSNMSSESIERLRKLALN